MTPGTDRHTNLIPSIRLTAMDNPIDNGTQYRPYLLPETVEVAFAAIKASLEKSFMARRLRPLTAPVIVRATDSDTISFTCAGREGRFTIPGDLTGWKIEKMRAYGIGSGYGLYTYIRTVDPSLKPSPVGGPVSDRLECIRNIEPGEPATATIISSLRWLYGAVTAACKEINRMFPHIPTRLPAEAAIAGDNGDTAHECRKNGAVGALSDDGRAASLWLWSSPAGMPVKIASLNLLRGKYIAGWCSPSLIAMILLQ